MRRVYLAIPYRGQEEKSFRVATQMAALLIRNGDAVYSPITHSHPIVTADPRLPGHFDFWQEMDYSYIALWATEVMVVCLPGWHRSDGVQKEIRYATAMGKPVLYVPCPPELGGAGA